MKDYLGMGGEELSWGQGRGGVTLENWGCGFKDLGWLGGCLEGLENVWISEDKVFGALEGFCSASGI